MSQGILKTYDGNDRFAFVSYSHKDEQTVMAMVNQMLRSGLRTWYDKGVNPGEEWPDVIAERLGSGEVFIAFVSKAFLDSHNCLREFNYAVSQNKPMLVVFLEEVTLTPAMKMQMASTQALNVKDYPSLEAAADDIVSFAIPKTGRAEQAEAEEESKERKNTARTIVVGLIVVLALVAAGAAVYLVTHYEEIFSSDANDGGLVTKMSTSKPALTAEQGVSVLLEANSEMSAKDYAAALEIMKGRLDVFAGESCYDMAVDADKVVLRIPKSCFGGRSVLDTLRCYITRPMELFLYTRVLTEKDSEENSEPIPVSRDEIESVSVETVSVKDLDLSSIPNNELLPDEIEVVRVVFNQEFADDELAKARKNWGDNLILVQDVTDDYDRFWFYYTYTDGGKSLLLIDTDPLANPNVLETVEYNMTHDALAQGFFVNINVDGLVEWEDPTSTSNVGTGQVAEDSLSGRLCSLQYTLDNYDESTAGERLDMDEALKSRLDAMGIPYAFGHYDERGSDVLKTVSVVKLAPGSLTSDISTLFAVNKYSSISLFSKGRECCSLNFMIESVQVEKNDEGHYCVAIAPPTGDYLTSSETGYLAFIAALEDGDVVCFKQDEALSDTGTAIAFEADYAGVDKDGRAVFGNLRSHSGTSFDESENAWMGEFCEACLSTMELMPYDIQAVGWQMTEDGVFSYDQELPNPYEQDQQNIIDAVHDIEKDAEVRFDDDQIRVILNLPMDSEFPQAVVEKTKVLYELVDLENPKHLENPKYSTLLIAFVDEDSDTKERARLWFTRWYVSDSIKPRIELSGVFANGRVEQYKDEVVSLVENDKELKGLIAEYGIYKEF